MKMRQMKNLIGLSILILMFSSPGNGQASAKSRAKHHRKSAHKVRATDLDDRDPACQSPPNTCPPKNPDPNYDLCPQRQGEICRLPTKWIQEYADCKDSHDPIKIKPSVGSILFEAPDNTQGEKFKIKQFDEINCDTHGVIHPKVQPFTNHYSGNDNYEGTFFTGNALDAYNRKCFKVVIKKSKKCTIDPHIIIGN